MKPSINRHATPSPATQQVSTLFKGFNPRASYTACDYRIVFVCIDVRVWLCVRSCDYLIILFWDVQYNNIFYLNMMYFALSSRNIILCLNFIAFHEEFRRTLGRYRSCRRAQTLQLSICAISVVFIFSTITI